MSESSQQFIAQQRSLAMVYSRTLLGIEAIEVVVEVHLANGLPSFTTVGLPETVVKESKERVRGAIINSGFEFPAKRITVNLAPADLPKAGGRFDLPIAIGILIASGQIPIANASVDLSQIEFIGELALDGHLREVIGVLPTALASSEAKRELIVPKGNAHEAALVQTQQSVYANHLVDVAQHLMAQNTLPTCQMTEYKKQASQHPDISEVKGQLQAKRALEIAASGEHSMLFIGPPGTGKSMLALRLPGIMPELDIPQALQTAAIDSISNNHFDIERWRQRPFRNPHHSSSSVALVGGGSIPKPGEISLAHNGVLFLDELTEFSRATLEQLREPLESAQIHIARANQRITYPANFMLITACNPCPCGYLGDGSDRCNCSGSVIERYRNKLSGPLIDRIDMHVYLSRVPTKLLRDNKEVGESSHVVQERVIQARHRQQQRQNCLNSQLSVTQINEICVLNSQSSALLEQASQRLQLSARAYHRILKLARTIADMQGSNDIEKQHIAEAIGYRSLDRR